MHKILIIIIVIFNLLKADWVQLNNISDEILINIDEETSDYIIINMKINGFTNKEIKINNNIFNQINIDKEPLFLKKGFPSLPHINRSIIIPNKSDSKLEIIDYEMNEFNNINVIPSKGNVLRNVNIDEVAHVWNDIYNENVFFPNAIVALKDPYILRDYRGQTIQFQPFQFNGFEKKLKVYSSITIKISFNGSNPINQILEDKSLKSSHDFNGIYNNQFINYQNMDRYSPISEEGEMLVICYDSFISSIQPLVDWKNQKGIKTTLVAKSNAGSSATSIKNFVQNFYNEHNLTYLLLVGDKSQIPTFNIGSGYSSGESDISYAYLSGNDSYPEFLVGRISAENTTHVSTQVNRTIDYEKNPQSGDWYTKGIVVASNEGSGAGHDGGESDWQHARNMRTDLLAYNYTGISEFYDGTHSGGTDQSGNPSATSVRSAINSGAGIIHYTGHGDTQLWVTSGFDNGDVNSLTNINELPFVCTVGCKSGDFGDGLCLGESFLRSTSNGQATGAIATFMSTIYQGWAPPMEAQDEMVDILTEEYSNNRKYTFGGISWNGCMKMNDAYGSSGYDETDHWTLFGDPSVILRTDSPKTININHSGNLDPNTKEYEVEINGTNDFSVAALSYDGIHVGSAVSENNIATISYNTLPNDISELTLTITGYNINTIIDNVSVGSACDNVIGDSNNDNAVNVLDIVLVVNFVLMIDSPDNCQNQASDTNQDGIINILDIVAIVNLILR